MSKHRLLFAYQALVVLPLLALPSGCVSVEVQADPAAAQTIAQHAERLMQPFQKGYTIYCRKLDVVVNAAFANRLGFPAGGTVSRDSEVEQVIWSARDRVKVQVGKGRAAPLAEPLQQKFHVLVGTTHFIVDQAVRVKKLLAARPTLTATAGGPVVLVRNASHAESLQEVQFVDGRIRTR